jgi:hypothetical protein
VERENKRLESLIRMLDPEDYRYIRAYDFRIESRFRRRRMRIYREELRGIVTEIFSSYQKRLSNIAAAGKWGAYPGLTLNTAFMLFSAAKLWTASLLFGLRLPVLINLPAHTARLEKFLKAEAISA